MRLGAILRYFRETILEIADRKPDLCISGINYGENLGMVLTCSGTVGAALEAASHNIPAIAISMETKFKSQRQEKYAIMNWDAAKNILSEIAAKIEDRKMKH